jgi:two-component SAPR family response regulator
MKILVVEDEPIIAMLLRNLLTQHGHEVIGPFARLDRAHKALAAHPIDLALLDVQLGSDFVFPLAHELKRMGIPFVFLTGHDALTLPPELKGAPSLTKPFQADALMKAVDRIG